jgi:hypothetical protein
VPPGILPQPVAGACRTRHDRLVVQIAANVGGQFGRRAIAAGAILLQRLHRDPVEIAAQHAHELSWARCRALRPSRLMYPIAPTLVLGRGGSSSRNLRSNSSSGCFCPACFQTAAPGQQHIENNSQRVDVGARVDVLHIRVSLLRTHVSGRSHKMSQLREHALARDRGVVALASPKSMMRGTGLPSTSTTRMFAGFRSRWMMAFWCACCTPSQAWMKSSSRSAILSFF